MEVTSHHLRHAYLLETSHLYQLTEKEGVGVGGNYAKAWVLLEAILEVYLPQPARSCGKQQQNIHKYVWHYTSLCISKYTG